MFHRARSGTLLERRRVETQQGRRVLGYISAENGHDWVSDLNPPALSCHPGVRTRRTSDGATRIPAPGRGSRLALFHMHHHLQGISVCIILQGSGDGTMAAQPSRPVPSPKLFVGFYLLTTTSTN